MAHHTASPPTNTAALLTGFGIGAFWLLMAFTCFWSSFRGYQHSRYDWGLLWGIVGALLAVAGIAAMVGTWWHLTRVARDH